MPVIRHRTGDSINVSTSRKRGCRDFLVTCRTGARGCDGMADTGACGDMQQGEPQVLLLLGGCGVFYGCRIWEYGTVG